MSKSYGPVRVLEGVDLSLDAGHAAALTGESGSGKSTLLHIAAGLEIPDGGVVAVDGAQLAAAPEARRAAIRRDRIGVIFQQFNLIPSLTVDRNLAFQAQLCRRDDAAWRAALVAHLGLEGLLDRYPEELSGGQQQRVAIGRALAARPALILADEPTGNLDEETSDAVLALMLDLVRETGAAMLFVTHSKRLADRIGRRLHISRGRLT